MGAGYTGLAAARETAAAGRRTLVLEADALGAGCSGRNGGQVAYSLKPSLGRLRARHGEERALAICREAVAASTICVARSERGLDCDWQQRGCFYGAHTARHFERMARDREQQPRGLEQRISVVPRARTAAGDRNRLLSWRMRIPRRRVGRSHEAAARAARRRGTERGAAIADHCRAERIRRDARTGSRSRPREESSGAQGVDRDQRLLGPHCRRGTGAGSFRSAAIRSAPSRWAPSGCARSFPAGAQHRRLAARRRLFPALRRRRAHHVRRPGGARRKRIRWPASPAQVDDDADISALARSRIDSRLGRVGGLYLRYDAASRAARRPVLLHGVLRAGRAARALFRQRIGQQMADLAKGRTALDDLAFPSRPYYCGMPWFLAPSVWAYRTWTPSDLGSA